MYSLWEGDWVLSGSERTILSGDGQTYTIDYGASSGATIRRDNIWELVPEKSTYSTNGAQTTVLERATAGYEELKIGGAAYVWWSYTDTDGNMNGHDYMKWADENNDEDGATGVATYAAIVMATTFALF